MKNRAAEKEYENIMHIRDILSAIPNYEDYFLLYDVTTCKPKRLTTMDLKDFTKCKSFTKKELSKANINQKIDELTIINMPDGGLAIDDYLYEDGSFQKMYNLHTGLVNLLKNGIIPMNQFNVYHCDIKDSNILVDDAEKIRLIDWGLYAEYMPFVDAPFPTSWRNRPFQYNVPFSVIIFTDSFMQKYTKFIKEDGGSPTETELKPFVINYINSWMRERGAGHFNFINEIMILLFSNDLDDVSEEDMSHVVETQITMDYIVNYIVDVLVNFTHFKENGSLNLREYLDNVFIKIVDIWGLISAYYPFLELLSNQYSKLNKTEMKIFKQLQFIFVEYLYNPRHEPIDMDVLFSDLDILGELHIRYLKPK